MVAYRREKLSACINTVSEGTGRDFCARSNLDADVGDDLPAKTIFIQPARAAVSTVNRDEAQQKPLHSIYQLRLK